MIDLQALKDVDDIDHITVEKDEDNAHGRINHFCVKRIAAEKFSNEKAASLLRHIELWYPETQAIIQKTDFADAESLYSALRAAREIILEKHSL